MKNKFWQKQSLIVLGLGLFLFGWLSVAFPVSAEPVIPDVLRPKAGGSVELPKYNAGVDKTIETYLCTPSGAGADLPRCIDRLYRFGITAGAIALVLILIISGYIYITTGEAGKGKAKSMIVSAVTGMAILLGSYMLLNFINPNLTIIKPIQPPIFTSPKIPPCSEVGFGADCITSTGQVSYGGSSVPGSANEAQYKDLISKYAQANGLEYCALSALIQKESSFNKLIVSNPPPNQVDPNSTPPSYNVSFDSSGHAIGLSQIYIFKGSTTRSGSEFGISGNLTVKDLIDPETSIKSGAHFFGKVVKERKGKLREAYDDYQAGRGGNSDPATLDKYMDMYTSCNYRNK